MSLIRKVCPVKNIFNLMSPNVSIHPFQSILVRWFLECRHSLLPSRLTTSNLPWFMNLTFQVPISIALYNIGPCLYHQSHPQVGVVLHPFILSGVISPLISSSILGTYWPWEFVFQCPIFLPFHIVHGVLKARILTWFAIPFSSGPRFVRTLHHDLSILGGPTGHGS